MDETSGFYTGALLYRLFGAADTISSFHIISGLDLRPLTRLLT